MGSSVETPRRFPRIDEILPLVKLRPPHLSRTRARLERAFTIDDLREAARRRAPRAVFDFVDGGADDEITLRRSVEAFRDVEFHPSVLNDVSQLDLGVEVLGGRSELPFGFAPIGFPRMAHAAGERATAAVAAAAGIPSSLSTMGTVSIEDFASAAGEGRRWFQLYLWKDRARSLALVERAWEAGFDTLLVTADTAVAGARLRDLHSGTTMPPALTVRSILDTVMHPAWLFDLVTTEPLVYASLNGESGSVEEMARTMFDQTVDVDDLAWLRDAWKGALVVKGVQSATDARRFADAGVDGVVLSSHGGRQLDRTAAPFHVLPRVRDELGDRISVLLDTGIRHGQDVVAALALGADFTLVGRAHMYGLMAGGRPGVQRAVDILRTQIDRTMRLLGVTSFAQLDSRHVTQLRRGVSSAEPTRHR